MLQIAYNAGLKNVHHAVCQLVLVVFKGFIYNHENVMFVVLHVEPALDMIIV